MTEENQKKLYEHFVRTEQKARAEEVLKVYPHFADTPAKETTKSKKEK